MINSEKLKKTASTKEGLISYNFGYSEETFDAQNIKIDLLKPKYDYGFYEISIINKKGILSFNQGKTFKTESHQEEKESLKFLIDTFRLIVTDKNYIQCLILSPTIQLAKQIFNIYKIIGEFLKVKIYFLIGGKHSGKDIFNVKKGPHILIGTPNRILSLIKRKRLNLDYLKSLVIDEADEMRLRGYNYIISEIASKVPKFAKISIFSTTLPGEIMEMRKKIKKKLQKTFVRNIKYPKIKFEGIKQCYINAKNENKLGALLQVFKENKGFHIIVYFKSNKKVELLDKEINKKGLIAFPIYSCLKQTNKEMFKKLLFLNKENILIIIFDEILIGIGNDIIIEPLIINYEIPKEKDTNIKNNGVSIRFGKILKAIKFVASEEKDFTEKIRNYRNIYIKNLPSDLFEFN